MKLIVQIPCLNEQQNLKAVIQSIPLEIPGISSIAILVVDDGSTDNTSKIAEEQNTLVERNTTTAGLARTFSRGLNRSLQERADIIVNLDGDNQYPAHQIPLLIAPILAGEADIVIGDRQTDSVLHFSLVKKIFQRIGSFVIRKLSRTDVKDAVSGFRAFSREAALKTTILSHYTYTLESILQADSKGLKIVSVPISTNPPVRSSRLMKNMWTYMVFSLATIVRVFTMYNPLRVFVSIGGILVFFGAALGVRFLYFYALNGETGKVQSLILAAILILFGGMTILVGFIADLIQFNRRLLEDVLERVKRIEYDKN